MIWIKCLILCLLTVLCFYTTPITKEKALETLKHVTLSWIENLKITQKGEKSPLESPCRYFLQQNDILPPLNQNHQMISEPGCSAFGSVGREMAFWCLGEKAAATVNCPAPCLKAQGSRLRAGRSCSSTTTATTPFALPCLALPCPVHVAMMQHFANSCHKVTLSLNESTNRGLCLRD